MAFQSEKIIKHKVNFQKEQKLPPTSNNCNTFLPNDVINATFTIRIGNLKNFTCDTVKASNHNYQFVIFQMYDIFPSKQNKQEYFIS
jgi:hypothetical protein